MLDAAKLSELRKKYSDDKIFAALRTELPDLDAMANDAQDVGYAAVLDSYVKRAPKQEAPPSVTTEIGREQTAQVLNAPAQEEAKKQADLLTERSKLAGIRKLQIEGAQNQLAQREREEKFAVLEQRGVADAKWLLPSGLPPEQVEAMYLKPVEQMTDEEKAARKDTDAYIKYLKKQADEPSGSRVVAGIPVQIALEESGKYGATAAGGAIGTAVAGPAGTPVGAGVGYVLGGVGSGYGASLFTQKVVEGRKDVSHWRAIGDGLINLVPGSELKVGPQMLQKISKVGLRTPVIRHGVVGAAAGGTAYTFQSMEDGNEFRMSDFLKASGLGAAIGTGLGATGQKLRKSYEARLAKKLDQPEAVVERMVDRGDPDVVGLINRATEDLPSELTAPRDSKTFVDRLTRKAQATLAPSQLIGEDATLAAINAQNRTSAAAQAADVMGAKIDRAFKKAKLSPEDEAQMWDFVSGVNPNLPERLQKVAPDFIQSRNEIASLQQRLLDAHHSGERVLDKSTREMIEKSLYQGDYLSRTYRFFEDPTFKPDKRMFDKAVQSLMQPPSPADVEAKVAAYKRRFKPLPYQIDQYRERVSKEGMTRTSAEKYLLELNERRAGNAADTISAVHSSNSGVLKRRTDLPREVRDYLGEYRNPGEKLAATQTKLSKLIEYAEADAKITESLRSRGLAKTAEEAAADVAVGNWVPLKLRATPEKAAGQTLFVHKDTLGAVSELYGMQATGRLPNAGARIANDIYHATVGLAKGSKVLWNPPSYAVQAYGNVAGLLNSLFVPTIGLGKGVMAGLSSMARSEVSAMIPVLRKFTTDANVQTIMRNKRYMELGYVDQSLAANDYMKALAAGAGPLSTGVRAILAPFGKVYSGFDTSLRIVAHENMMRVLSKAAPTADVAKLEEESARIINDIYPNFSRLNSGLKTLSSHGIPFSQFASFSMELMRNQFNHVRIADAMISGRYADEMSKRLGVPVDANKLQNHGNRMLVGLASMHAGASGAIKGWNRTQGGMSEEEEQAWRRTGAKEWDTTAASVLTKGHDGDTVYSANASYLMPHAQLGSYVDAAMRGETPVEAGANFVKAMVNDLGGEGSFAMRAYMQAANNINFQTGDKISYSPDQWDNLKERVMGSMGEAFKPGIIREVERARTQTPETTAMRQFGVRVNTESFQTGFQFKVKSIQESMTGISSQMRSIRHKLEDGKITPEEFQSRYNELNTSYRKLQENLALHVKDARVWKWSEDMIQDQLSDAKIGSQHIRNARKGLVSDLPQEAKLSISDVYERDFMGKPLREQTRLLKEMAKDDPITAMSMKEIIKGQERARLLKLNPDQQLYMRMPVTGGDRAKAIFEDMQNHTDPDGFRRELVKKGVIDAKVDYQLKQLKQAVK
jgi:hypothetical protein